MNIFVAQTLNHNLEDHAMKSPYSWITRENVGSLHNPTFDLILL